LQGTERRSLVATLEPCLAPGELIELQASASQVHAAPALLDYIQAVVEHTRRAPEFASGLSPRAALGVLACSQGLGHARRPRQSAAEDVQAILPGVAGHRLAPAHEGARKRAAEVTAALIEAVPIP